MSAGAARTRLICPAASGARGMFTVALAAAGYCREMLAALRLTAVPRGGDGGSR